MHETAKLIVQIPQDGAVDRALRAEPLTRLAGAIILERLPADAQGRLDAPSAGHVVLTLPSPEGLREAEEVRRVIGQHQTGDQPLVVVIEAADELREDELEVLVAAASHASLPVILRVIADG
jgi:hypothetical protein